MGLHQFATEKSVKKDNTVFIGQEIRLLSIPGILTNSAILSYSAPRKATFLGLLRSCRNNGA
jgi:hypothetical protein